MTVSERFQGANVVDAGRLSPYWGEHAARYLYALPHAANKTVLDIACGTGYGIALLRDSARFVLGVDVDPEAAAQARAECRSNAAVLLGDGLILPLADGSIDLITSFETIEHLKERPAFLAELHRVLRPAGTLILSTPNARYTRPVNGKPANPFHIYEYEPDELLDELSEYFDVVQMLGQDLDPSTGTPPFLIAQQRLPSDFVTQARLFGWRAFNKIPFALRERLSEVIWQKPFYPTEMDYNFSTDAAKEAPTLVAICRKA